MAPTVPIEVLRGVVRTVSVLSVDPIAKDHASLRQIFSRSEWSLCPNSKWTLTTSTTAESAIAAIRQNPISVLLCGCDHQPDTWKKMLEVLTPLPHPPLLIVTSRTADDRLWAEALNLGAYDVLAKPFDQDEVVRIVSLAWLHWKERLPQLPDELPERAGNRNYPHFEALVSAAGASS